MAEVVEGRIAHQTPVRLRVTAPTKRYDRAFFKALQEQVSLWAPVKQVDVNPATASVVIYSRDSQAVLDLLRREGALTIVAPAKYVVHFGAQAERPRFTAVDAQIRRWSGGRLDAKRVSVALVVAASLTLKLARGNPMSAGVLLLLLAGGVARRRYLASLRRKEELLAPPVEAAA
jgi:hypothetical protein